PPRSRGAASGREMRRLRGTPHPAGRPHSPDARRSVAGCRSRRSRRIPGIVVGVDRAMARGVDQVDHRIAADRTELIGAILSAGVSIMLAAHQADAGRAIYVAVEAIPVLVEPDDP